MKSLFFSTPKGLKAPALLVRCFLLAFAMAPAHASASGLCGPDILTERFVELPFEKEEDFELQQTRDGGYLFWTYGHRASEQKPIAKDHELSFYDKSKNLITERTYRAEQIDWIQLGLYPTNNTLVMTKGPTENIMHLLDHRGSTIASSAYVETSDLKLGEAILDLQDGGLLFLGRQGEEQRVAIKVSNGKGIDWVTPIFTQWSSTYPSKAIRLNDGSIVIISNGSVRSSEGTVFDQAAAIRLDTDGKILWTRAFTNGFDDQLSDVAQMADGSLVFAGVTRLRHRHKGGNKVLWVFKTDLDGRIQKEHLIHESEFAVGSDTGKIAPHPSGAILAKWSIWGPTMNDLQYQECTYLLTD